MDIKEKPIIFSTEMVKAILRGNKTQTRRIIKPQFSQLWGSGYPNESSFKAMQPAQKWKDAFAIHVDIKDSSGVWAWLFCPFGKVGDKLWVCETWAENHQMLDSRYSYRANHTLPKIRKWKPSIFMPRQASRITLEITGIQVEKLNEISDSDAEKEGINLIDFNCFENYLVQKDWFYEGRNQREMHALQDPRMSFASLWDLINSKRGFSWESNPFVWAIEFKKL